MPKLANKKMRAIVLISWAALFTGSLTSCGKFQSPQALISEARELQQKGDIKAAVIQLKNALQKDPDNAEARYLLGTIYNRAGDSKSAEKELRKALALGMDPVKVLPDLGNALLPQGQFQQILDETTKIPVEKQTAEILTLRGNASLGLGKSQAAKALFDQVLQSKPDFSAALIGLARLALIERNIDAASQLAEQAVTKNPKDKDAWLFKADLLRAQGETEPALAAYEQVLKRDQTNTSAHVNKAFIEIGSGKFDAAKADIDAARKASPNNLLVFNAQALLDFRQGKNEAALESIQQVLRVAPDYMPAVLLAGVVHYALGSMTQSEQQLKKYLETYPGNLYARKLLASTLLKSRQPQRALDVLAPALKIDQPDAQVLSLVGESYMQTKEFTKATEYFEKASELEPKTAAIHTALGLSKLAQGEKDRAIEELETAAGLDSKSTKADYLLVMTHLRLKEFDKALAAASALQKEQPDNPLGSNLKGAAYMGKKDFANARSSFEKAISLQPTYFSAVANLAKLDLQDKKPDLAKKRFEALLEKDKKNIQAMTALANLALSQGQQKEATTWLERSSQANPDVLQPSLLLALHYLRSGEKEKALNFTQKLQGSNPSSPEVLDLLAQVQFANGNKSAALESYQKLATMKSDSAPVQLRIASMHMAMQNQAAAADALKKALELQPDYVDAQQALASLEESRGNHEQALVIARQLQKNNSKSPAGFELEGALLIAQNKPEPAVKAFEQAFAIGKNGTLMVKLHAALTQAGKGKEADIRLAQWLKEHPDDAAARIYLAEIYLAANQNKSAIEQYQAILNNNPSHVPALNNLAWLYQQEKDPRALEFAEKAHQLAPENPGAQDTLGWILVEQGDVKRGLPLLQQASTLAPQTGEIRYHYAAALAKSGDKAKARKELEQLLATVKAFPHIEEAKALLKQL